MADLTTLAAVKAYAGITSTEMDAMLAAMITRASAAVENFLQTPVGEGPIEEVRHGHNGATMLLTGMSPKNITLVEVDGKPIQPASTFEAAGWWLVRQMITLRGQVFCKGRENVRINYTAGYPPGQIPPDIEQAVIETVMTSYKRRDHIDVSSKSLAGETISYITAELTPSARSILASYRRVAPL